MPHKGKLSIRGFEMVEPPSKSPRESPAVRSVNASERRGPKQLASPLSRF
jgi:hypothetical protein